MSATHNMVQPINMQSEDINALNKTVVCSGALDNGNLVVLGAPVTTALGGADLSAFVATLAAADGILAIVDDPEVMEDTEGFRVENIRDPRYRFVPASRPCRARILAPHDEFAVTAALVNDTPAATTKQFVIVDSNPAGEFAAVASYTTEKFVGEIIDFDYAFQVGTTRVPGYRIRVLKA
jgi:hypothetical protein